MNSCSFFFNYFTSILHLRRSPCLFAGAYSASSSIASRTVSAENRNTPLPVHLCSLLYLVFCSFSERFCSLVVLSHTTGTINRIFNAFCRQKAARLQMRNRTAGHLFISFNAQRHIPGCAAHGPAALCGPSHSSNG